ncbi:hypothetical protein AALP_AAs71059U000200 [Arabis alpina]|uniref:Uncharacterized protein n=1 Tax=Arabis alpina TaxID=50452 RepID=A0A087FXI0_ARAAL|nr:hypothetical protein AALP_AAs71059U000200 [Arabis alpina]
MITNLKCSLRNYPQAREHIKTSKTFDEVPVTESENSETSSSYFIRRDLTETPSDKEVRLPQKAIREADGSSSKLQNPSCTVHVSQGTKVRML